VLYGGKCKHQVTVKKIAITEDMDVVGMLSKLENLRRASMWCRNVCTFHGGVRMDGRLCLIMDRYNTSIQAEMRQNKGRLTLEQILRFFLYTTSSCFYICTVFPSRDMKNICMYWGNNSFGLLDKSKNSGF